MVYVQKQSSKGRLKKRYSENIQQVYRKTSMPKCDFNKVTFQLALQLHWNRIWHGCSPVNLQHIFRTPFSKNTSKRLLLYATSRDSGIPKIYIFFKLAAALWIFSELTAKVTIPDFKMTSFKTVSCHQNQITLSCPLTFTFDKFISIRYILF